MSTDQISTVGQTNIEQSPVQTHQASTDGITLLEDEVVLANVHPAFVNWWKQLVVAGLFGLAFLGGLANLDPGSILMTGLVTAGIVAYVYYAAKESRYIVTSQRVMKKVGLLRRSTGETRIKDIRSLTTNQGLLERIVSKGSVQIDSTGAGGTLGIDGVENHEELANTIRRQQQYVEKTRQ